MLIKLPAKASQFGDIAAIGLASSWVSFHS
jgi:hypothetical protein